MMAHEETTGLSWERPLNSRASSSYTQTPIAIVGMSCKYAGDATSPEELWKLCVNGRSAWSKIPQDRFVQESFYHPLGERQTSTNVAGGYFFKDDVSLFDASFFNMSSDVAKTMDPQCRLQLESVYEALENAGIPIETVEGTNASVFAGLFFRDYQDSFMRDPESFPRQVITGNGATMMSNRISHFFDLVGPSVTIDTACSTALVALHMASQSLRAGESELAIVTGVNAMLNPDNFILLSSLGFLSPDGKCYAFDSRASGYGRGEGVATLLLKPLDDAIRDKDPVRAIVRGSAVNQNGKTQTITSPSLKAQESVIRACYQNAGLNPSKTGYVEAHGTGTQAGDPVEAEAIAKVLVAGRPSNEFLSMGSIKTNIGHTEAASGIASIIKMVFALDEGLIPPSINFRIPNKKAQLDERRLKVPQSLTKWPANYERRASINNFGYGGTNAHIILDGADSSKVRLRSNVSQNNKNLNITGRRRIFLLSSKDEAAIQQMIMRLKAYLEGVVAEAKVIDEQLLDDLAYTLGQRRSRFPWSIATSASQLPELIRDLEPHKLKTTRSLNQPRLGFVFTGQGAQWHAMGRELISTYPIFRESLEEAGRYLKDFGCPWSLMAELTKDIDTSRVNDVKISPSLCIAVQISLVRLLRDWSIVPAAVTGHSSGEVAAAFAAGAIDYRTALAIVYSRAALTTEERQRSTGRGGMLAVALSREDVQQYISKISLGKVVIACINSPSSVTISGDYGAIEELESELRTEKVFARRLKIDTAFHSHHMQPIAKDYHAFLQKTLKKAGEFDGIIYSSPVTGCRIPSASEIVRSEHWVGNMLQPVEFSDCFQSMCFDDAGVQAVDFVIEVGPHGALAGPMRQILAQHTTSERDIFTTTCLTRNVDAVQTMHTMVTQLLARGYRPNLGAINFPCSPSQLHVLCDLPSYPWTHKVKHWSESRMNRLYRQKAEPAHDLLGSLTLGSNPASPVWRQILRAPDLPWLYDHKIQGEIVYPAAGFLCMAIESISQVNEKNRLTVSQYNLRSIEFTTALIIPETSEGIEVQISLCPLEKKDNTWHEFRIFSVDGSSRWTEHCRGSISVEVGEEAPSLTRRPNPEMLECREANRRVKPEDLYRGLRSGGIMHGERFQNLRAINSGASHSTTVFQVADIASTMPAQYQKTHIIHPTTLDSIIVAAYSCIPITKIERDEAKVPRAIQALSVAAGIGSAAGASFEAHSNLIYYTNHAFEASVVVVSEGHGSRKPITELMGLKFQSLGPRSTHKNGHKSTALWCSSLCWRPDITLMDSRTLGALLQLPIESQEVEVLRDLKLACFILMRNALEKLVNINLNNIKPHYRRYINWIKTETEGLSGHYYRTIMTDETERLLLEKVSNSSVHGSLIYDLGMRIRGIVSGEVQPLGLMVEHKFLDNVLRWDRSYRQIGNIVRFLCHKYPRAKFLEVGAGTGSCTQGILEALDDPEESNNPRFASYDFTDVSPGFFESARVRFAQCGDSIRYKILDVNIDGQEQGFDPGSYDVVVASHVIHATRNVTQTLKNLKRLLKPGGKIIMAETTNPVPELGLAFGALPGWWLGEEKERESSPTLSVQSWEHYMNRAGFRGIDVEVHDCDDDSQYSSSVLMSTADSGEQFRYSPEVVVVLNEAHTKSPWLSDMSNAIEEVTSKVPEISSLDQVDARDKFCVILDEMTESLLDGMSDSDFSTIKSICSSATGVLWVSRGGSVDCNNPGIALHLGLLRVMRCEHYGRPAISLDLDPLRDPWTKQSAEAIERVLRYVLNKSRLTDFIDTEFSERNGIISISRAYHSLADNRIMASDYWEEPILQQPFNNAKHTLRLRKDAESLDHVEFVQDSTARDSTAITDNSVEILPKAFGLPNRGYFQRPGNRSEAMIVECSGIVTKVGNDAQGICHVGDRVCGVFDGQIGNTIRTPKTNIVTIPEDMTFETGTSLSLAFVTAYYSLFEIARLRKGERLLIADGTSAVGQAAMLLADMVDADVFIGVESLEAKKFLVDNYSVRGDRVLLSADNISAKDISCISNPPDTDIIFQCSTASDNSFYPCLASFGRYIHLGQPMSDGKASMRRDLVSFNQSLYSVDMVAVARLKGNVFSRILKKVVGLVQDKTLQPIRPFSIYSVRELGKALKDSVARSAFEFQIIVPRPDDVVQVRSTKPAAIFFEDASYLIIGGFGGIGKSICRWMAERGASNLILLSRNADRSWERSAHLSKDLENLRCRVYVQNCDVSDLLSLKKVLNKVSKEWPPIRGIIQSAMVLNDSILDRMSIQQWRAVVQPKVQGTWNLHTTTMQQDLDFFIILSSIVGVAGNIGQSNYAAGGAFQDAFARYRSSMGLPCVSIDLGAVGSIGYLASAESRHLTDRFTRMGFEMLNEDNVLKIVESAIISPLRDPSSSQIIVGAPRRWGLHSEETAWSHDMRFTALTETQYSTSEANQVKGNQIDINTQLGEAKDPQHATQMINKALVTKLSDIFMTPESDIRSDAPLGSYGVDSLVAVELRNWVVSRLKVEISIFEVLQSVSVEALSSMIAAKKGDCVG